MLRQNITSCFLRFHFTAVSRSPDAMEMNELEEVAFAGNESKTTLYERLILKNTEAPSHGGQYHVPLIESVFTHFRNAYLVALNIANWEDSDIRYCGSVVHVTVLRPLDDRHKLSELLTLAHNTERRELVFQSDLSSFSGGDLVQEFVQQEAMCLLRDLLAARRPATPVSVIHQNKSSY